MARKIFVSYKHEDNQVAHPFLAGASATARDYVDSLQQYFEGQHIYKGERDDEDLSHFTDETIASHLRENIFDSSVTLVLVSKGMKEMLPEKDQWIPWEIAYSLREKTKDGQVSRPNAMLALVLPDELGNYEHFVSPLCNLGCYRWKNNNTFEIVGKNMFNRRSPITTQDIGHGHNTLEWIHLGDNHSYIHPVHWHSFVANPEKYINIATHINDNIDDFDITKQI